MDRKLLTQVKCKKGRTHKAQAERGYPGGTETHCASMQGWILESHSVAGGKLGRDEGQQEGLLEGYWKQKEG